MRGRRLWCKVNVHGGETRVYVKKGLLEVDGVQCDAVYDPDKNEIEVAHSGNENLMKMKLLHELLHVCFKGASGDLRERVFGGKTTQVRHDREELIVSFLEPVLYDMLMRNGYLKLPKPPKF